MIDWETGYWCGVSHCPDFTAEGDAMSTDIYDLKAMVREYAEAKIDFDAHRLDEGDLHSKDRYARLVAIEQLLIHVSGVQP